MDAKRRSTFPDGLTKGQLLNPFCGHQGKHLTTLLDLCTDDKTAQREEYRKMYTNRKNKGHGSTFLKHVFNTGRDKAQKRTNKRLRSNSDRRFKFSAEGSKTSQTHQRVDVPNTDHKDVAVFRESSRIFYHPKVLKQTQRCFSSAFLASQ